MDDESSAGTESRPGSSGRRGRTPVSSTTSGASCSSPVPSRAVTRSRRGPTNRASPRRSVTPASRSRRSPRPELLHDALLAVTHRGPARPRRGELDAVVGAASRQVRHPGAGHQRLGRHAAGVDAGAAEQMPLDQRRPAPRSASATASGTPPDRSPPPAPPRSASTPGTTLQSPSTQRRRHCAPKPPCRCPPRGAQISPGLRGPSGFHRNALRVLLVEDSEADATLIVHALQTEGRLVRFHRVDTARRSGRRFSPRLGTSSSPTTGCRSSTPSRRWPGFRKAGWTCPSSSSPARWTRRAPSRR
jgi:hypothetical protein